MTAGEVFSELHAASGMAPTDFEAGLLTLEVELVTLPVAAGQAALPRPAVHQAPCLDDG